MEQTDYKKLRSEIFLQYGVELDETSLIILYILSSVQAKRFSEQNKKLDNAVQNINQSKKMLQADKEHPNRQAFWFGFGNLGFAIIFSVVVLFLSGVAYFSQKQDNEKINKEWLWYKTYYEIEQTHNQKDLKDFLKNNPIN